MRLAKEYLPSLSVFATNIVVINPSSESSTPDTFYNFSLNRGDIGNHHLRPKQWWVVQTDIVLSDGML